MNRLLRAWIFLLAVTMTTEANADWSRNIGWASDYYFCAVFQADSSANGGLDYSSGGFYAGTWAADVGDGLEVGAYFSYGVGFTDYYYTQDFDDTYKELNLSTGYSIATFDLAFGRYDNFDQGDQQYTYYSLTLEKEGFYGKIAGVARDFSGEYLEFGY